MTGSMSPRPAGVPVLGMHRSGTSVVAGVLSALGLDGGPEDTMFSADKFNSDGYWEQRPIVELHDELLRDLGGFASAPPEPTERMSEASEQRATARIGEFVDRFDRPWFVKDPRQCLLMPAWASTLTDDDVIVVVSRQPDHVVRSLRHRNGYSLDLAAGMWETYTSAMLQSISGRACHFIQYDELLDDPYSVISDLAATMSSSVLISDPVDDERLSAAQALVRPRETASSSTSTPVDEGLHPEQRALFDVIGSLRGSHPSFVTPTLPSLADAGQRAIRRRRRRLRVADVFIRRNADRRAMLDRRSILSRRR